MDRGGKEKPEAALPIRTAIACSYCARKIPRLVNDDWALCSVLSASTTEIWSPIPVSYSALVQVVRLLVGGHGFRIDLDQCVLPAYFKEVFRQIRLLGETLKLQIRGAGLRVVLRVAHFIADSAKEVRRPGNIQR